MHGCEDDRRCGFAAGFLITSWHALVGLDNPASSRLTVAIQSILHAPSEAIVVPKECSNAFITVSPMSFTLAQGVLG